MLSNWDRRAGSKRLALDSVAMSTPLTVGDVIAGLERRYPPEAAQDWDAVGLVVGDRSAPVRSVLFAVDPVTEVVDEAIEIGADLIVTHHPLMLRGVTSVAADTPKGAVVHRLIRGGIALYVAHTNADAADGGVNTALAELLGLTHTEPIAPAPGQPLDLLITYVPSGDAAPLRSALSAAGAGAVGDYTGCSWSVAGTGRFTPGQGASPAIGAVGQSAEVEEHRVEMVLPPGRRAAVIAALRDAHPYEEPAFSLLSTAPEPAGTGLGRIGDLAQPVTLAEFARTVARVLPATAHGVRVAGELERRVSRIAVCGGSGDSMLDAVRKAGADVFLTADLRHHPASEARAAAGAPALIDVAHWASEWPWLPVAASAVTEDARDRGAQVSVRVSTRVSDPWTARLDQPDREGEQ